MFQQSFFIHNCLKDLHLHSSDLYIKTIDSKIEEKSLLKHPFYKKWTEGALSIEALRDYTCQYYHHVAAFPTYLSALHSNVSNVKTRRHILQNLIDEEAGRPNHPELWQLFAMGIGVNGQDPSTVEKWDETENLISSFRRLCGSNGTAEGLAALYAYESQVPEVAEQKVAGLRKHYGIDKDEYLAYFKIHIDMDKEHAAVERRLLKDYINDDNVQSVYNSVDVILDALWEMLSGVCRRHDIPLDF